jgi:hypothetical protein
VAYLAREPQTADAIRFGFALAGEDAHGNRISRDRAFPVLAAGASDNVPVLVLVAALSARNPKSPCCVNNSPRTRRATLLELTESFLNKMKIINCNDLQASQLLPSAEDVITKQQT